MLLMGKSTISTGPFSIAFCMFTRGYVWGWLKQIDRFGPQGPFYNILGEHHYLHYVYVISLSGCWLFRCGIHRKNQPQMRRWWFQVTHHVFWDGVAQPLRNRQQTFAIEQMPSCFAWFAEGLAIETWWHCWVDNPTCRILKLNPCELERQIQTSDL